MCVYIYIHMYIVLHVCMCVYIYIYIQYVFHMGFWRGKRGLQNQGHSRMVNIPGGRGFCCTSWEPSNKRSGQVSGSTLGRTHIMWNYSNMRSWLRNAISNSWCFFQEQLLTVSLQWLEAARWGVYVFVVWLKKWFCLNKKTSEWTCYYRYV